MVDFTKPSGNHSTHPKLFQWVKDYFTKAKPLCQQLKTIEQSKLPSAGTSEITAEKQPNHSACGGNSSEKSKPSKGSEQNFHGEPDRKRTKLSSAGKAIYFLYIKKSITLMYCIEVAAAASTIGSVDSMVLSPLYLQHQGTVSMYFSLVCVL